MFENNPRKNKILFLFVAVIILALVLIYFFNQSLARSQTQEARQDKNPNGLDLDSDFFDDEQIVFCAMDAKICPDGSYVGRSGPNCEFAPCPDSPNGSGAGDIFSRDPSMSLAEEISACLVFSDLGSRETCQRLLALIQDYQACEAAGFPILESYPTQCVLPDGRSFSGPEYFVD